MRILAHRGASGYAPENTFASFDLACRMGAAGLETDIRMTRDGAAVLVHDERVDRTTNGQGLVAELDWADLAELDAGAWYGPAFAGERVPRLDAFLERYGGRAELCLEVKCEAVIGAIVQAFAAAPEALACVEFASFEWELLLAVRQALPGAVLAGLVRRADADAGAIGRAADAGMAMICPPVSAIAPELVAAAHAAGLMVRAWGVQTRDELAHLIACNVDGTTLNWPDWHTAAATRRYSRTTIPS